MVGSICPNVKKSGDWLTPEEYAVKDYVSRSAPHSFQGEFPLRVSFAGEEQDSISGAKNFWKRILPISGRYLPLPMG